MHICTQKDYYDECVNCPLITVRVHAIHMLPQLWLVTS